LRKYANPKPSEEPDGVVTVAIDIASGMRATPACPQKSVGDEVFVAGTEPVAYCSLHGGRGTGTTVTAWDTSASEMTAPAQNYVPGLPPRRNGSETPPLRRVAPGASGRKTAKDTEVTATPVAEEKKKGLLDHIKDIFR
jgi:hypothetical protein